MGRPGNSLLNHLSVSNYWNKPIVSINRNSLSWIYYAFLKRVIQILFKYNNVYSIHLFYNKYFTHLKYNLTLPVFITQHFFYKFYRIGTISNSRLNIKKNYLIRLGISNIYFFSLKFYLLNDWILVFFGFFKPKKYTLSNFLNFFKTIKSSKINNFNTVSYVLNYFFIFLSFWKKFWFNLKILNNF